MCVKASVGVVVAAILMSCQPLLADEAAQIELVFRNHSEAIARADLVRARAVDKAREDAVAQLLRIAARAYKANDRLSETNAWKAVLKLDRSHKKAIQYFTDLGTLDKVLAEVSNTGVSAPSKTVISNTDLQKWMKEVASLPAEKQVEVVSKKLVALNPGFDGKVTPIIDSGVVNTLSFASDKVVDITPIRALTGLTSLTCAGSGTISPLTDLSPVQGLKLTYLNCSFTGISDLTPVKGMSLVTLNAEFTSISDLTPVKGMPLTVLAVSKTKVSDLSPVKGMKLVSFGCHGTEVADISPLKGMPINHLSCIDTKVRDLSPVKGMPLISLSMKDSLISDLSPLVGSKITGLSINGTLVADISPLKGLPLSVLYCEGTKVTKLSALQGLPLTRIWCDIKDPGDVTILRGIKTLESINDEPATDFLKKQTSN